MNYLDVSTEKSEEIPKGKIDIFEVDDAQILHSFSGGSLLDFLYITTLQRGSIK